MVTFDWTFRHINNVYWLLVVLFKKMENEVYQLAKKWFAALSNPTKVCEAAYV